MSYLVSFTPKGVHIGKNVKLVVLYADGGTAVVGKQRIRSGRHAKLFSGPNGYVSFDNGGKHYHFETPQSILTAARKQGVSIRRSIFTSPN